MRACTQESKPKFSRPPKGGKKKAPVPAKKALMPAKKVIKKAAKKVAKAMPEAAPKEAAPKKAAPKEAAPKKGKGGDQRAFSACMGALSRVDLGCSACAGDRCAVPLAGFLVRWTAFSRLASVLL